MKLEEGANAPDFSLQDANGKTHKLNDYKGKTLVLYFYPKDGTPGCMVEACSFRDENSKIMQKGAEIIGISPDNSQSHQKFISKYKLNFTLLSDTDHAVAGKYGVWGPKEYIERKYDGIIRSTFIIDKKGKIKKAMYNVSPKDHAKEILAAL